MTHFLPHKNRTHRHPNRFIKDQIGQNIAQPISACRSVAQHEAKPCFSKRGFSRLNALFFVTFFSSAAISSAHADTIFGLYAGAQSWNGAVDGDFNTLGDTAVDVEETLGLDDDTSTSLYVAVEHPIPLLPNVKLRKTSIELNDQTTLTASNAFTFQGSGFTAGSLQSDIDLSHTDGTLYFEILDNWVSLDIGLTARKFDGSIRLAGSSTASAEIDDTIALLYGSAQFDLPFSGLYARVEGNGLTFEDHNHTDLLAIIGYESKWRFGAELGYRMLTLDLDELSIGSDYKLNSDLSLGGFFLGLTLHI